MIPDEAVEAARDAMKRFEVQSDPDGRFGWDAYARAALEAAAPHLMAAAWDEGLEVGLVSAVRIDSAPDANPYRKPA